MIPPRVPGQLADEPVILVEILPCMREDQVGLEPALQLLEHVLHLAAYVGKESIAKPVDDNLSVGCRTHEGLGARPRLALSLALGAEDDPCDLDLGTRPA